MRAIRPYIITQTSPQTIQMGQPLIISARFYDKRTNLKQRVSHIYLNIISLKDGHTIWPVEVVRKDDWKMDIEVGSDNMKAGHDYLVRVSNNRNLSPQGATEFKVQKGNSKAILLSPLALPLSQSLIPFITKTVEQNFTPDELTRFLKSKFPDMDANEIKRLRDTVLDNIRGKIKPVDDVTKKMIKKKKFITQMDARVCPICLEAQSNSSPGLPSSEYYTDDSDAPRIPLHFNDRCTYDIIFNDEFEASFEEIKQIYQAAKVAKILKILPYIEAIS